MDLERIAVTPGHAAAMIYQEGFVGPIPLALAQPFTRAGTRLIAFDSQPSRLMLSADKFHAHPHEEGLDAIIAQREPAGTSSQPAHA